MHGTAVESLSTGHHDFAGDGDLAEDERLARSEEKKWPVGSAISVMIAINVLLWIAMYLGVQKLL